MKPSKGQFWVVEEVMNKCKSYRDNTAVIYYDASGNKSCLSYRNLEDSIHVVNNKLIDCFEETVSQGMNYIGILVDPGENFPAVLLGILKCGFPFICFELNRSRSWLENAVKKLNVNVVITDSKCSKYFNACMRKGFNIIDNFILMGENFEIWVSVDEGINTTEKALLEDNICYDDSRLFYAIQTTGSTGKPKIVQVLERCIKPNILGLREIFCIDESDVIYFSSPVTFDPSIIELFLALTTGAALFIVESKLKAAAHEVLNALFPIDKAHPRLKATFVQTTPSIFLSWPEDVVRKTMMNDETQLKTLALGGEACPNWEVISRYRSKNNKTSIFYLYGITEVSCWASAHLVQPNDSGSILGSPLKETLFQVKQEDGKIITEGEGEIFIGGSSRYCLVDDEQMNDIKLPVFRSTGDIVKVTNAKYFYIGRKDTIIKRWGQRVCLSEIERSISSHCEYVKNCSCFYDDMYGIILFVVVPKSHSDIDYVNEIRICVRNGLNTISVPDLVFYIDEIPSNKHGKVDLVCLKKVMEEKISSFKIYLKFPCKSKEEIKLKFHELWEKNTYSRSAGVGSKLAPRTSSSNVVSVCGGFLSVGGSSVAALQFVSELSEFVKVPKSFIGKLLCDSSYNECLQNLIENYDGSILEMPVNLGEGSENKLSNPTLLNKYCFSETKRMVDIDTHKSSEIKKRKFNCLNNDYVVYSKCRCRIMKYYLTDVNYYFGNFDKINLRIKWKYNLKKCVDASPVVASYKSGRKLVFIGSHSGASAVIDLFNGAVISLCHLPDRIESSALVSKCGTRYYLGCYDKNFYCIGINGEVLWSLNTKDMIKSTAVYGNQSMIIIGSYDHNVYGICSENGRIIWCYKGSAGFLSVPLVSENGVILASSLDGVCVALSVDTGDPLWNYTLSSPVFSSPVMYKGNVVFAEVTGVLHCLDINNGTLNWTFNVDGNIFSSLTLCEIFNEEAIVFGCHDHYVYCLSVKSEPKIVWRTLLESSIFSTPSTICGSGGALVASTTNGTVNILRLTDGCVLVSLFLTGEIFSSPVVEENNIVVGCRDNNLYCLEIYEK